MSPFKFESHSHSAEYTVSDRRLLWSGQPNPHLPASESPQLGLTVDGDRSGDEAQVFYRPAEEDGVHRHVWPGTRTEPLGTIVRCECGRFAELRIMMFDRGETLGWMEISPQDAVTRRMKTSARIVAVSSDRGFAETAPTGAYEYVDGTHFYRVPGGEIQISDQGVMRYFDDTFPGYFPLIFGKYNSGE